jgi:hypothetical protein
LAGIGTMVALLDIWDDVLAWAGVLPVSAKLLRDWEARSEKVEDADDAEAWSLPA